RLRDRPPRPPCPPRHQRFHHRHPGDLAATRPRNRRGLCQRPGRHPPQSRLRRAMNSRLSLAAALLPLLFPLAAPAQEGKLYLAATETEALKAKEGQRIVVHGEIRDSGKSASGTNFVNFKGAEFFL